MQSLCYNAWELFSSNENVIEVNNYGLFEVLFLDYNKQDSD